MSKEDDETVYGEEVMIKKSLISVLTIIVCILAVKADAVVRIVGASTECDTTNAGCNPIPLTVTTLCTVSCTRLSSPSFTDANRMWGTDTSNCRTSIDGGVTWTNCASNPDAASLYNYESSPDGGVLAAGLTNGGTRCKIYKSTNNAVSWANVFDEAIVNCGGPANGGTMMKCGTNGVCALVFASAGTAETILSTDNGDSWARTALTAISYTPISLVFDGSLGFSTPISSDGFSNFKAFNYSGGWTLSTVWPSLTRCWPSIILNSAGSSVCQTGGTGISYTVRGPTGTLLNTITLPGANPSANAGMIGISTGGNNLYLITSDDSARVSVWATANGLTSASLVKIFTGTAVAGMTNQADANFRNGCIYFSAGTATPIFAKIC